MIINPMDTDSARMVRSSMSAIRQRRIEFQTFSAKLKFSYEGNEKKFNDINAFLRMKKDSVIWVSINAALGIEAFRIMITPISVKVMDKLDKTVSNHDFSYLQEISKLPIDFSSLQDLLIGNPVFLDSNVVTYQSAEKTTALTTVGLLFKNFSLFANPGLQLQRTKLDDIDVFRSRSADLTYLDYIPSGALSFSSRRHISVADKKRLEIDLEFKQVVFNDAVNFPFNVPSNYKLK